LDSATPLNEKDGQEYLIKRRSGKVEITSKEMISENKPDTMVLKNSGNSLSPKSCDVIFLKSSFECSEKVGKIKK